MWGCILRLKRPEIKNGLAPHEDSSSGIVWGEYGSEIGQALILP